MDIVIDIGNTRAKIALYQGDILVEQHVLPTIPDKLLLQNIAARQIERGIVSTVSALATLWIDALPHIQWLQFSHHTPIPFHNKYKTPHTLGLDRIALAAAATKYFPSKNTFIIDAGTCVTYDFIDDKQNYLGGLISPGLHMRLKAMHQFTERLPEVLVDTTVNFMENSTEKCLQAGALHGLAAEINGLISQYTEQFTNIHTVVTGGDAEKLAPLIKNSIFATPNFLVDGLHEILLHNKL